MCVPKCLRRLQGVLVSTTILPPSPTANDNALDSLYPSQRYTVPRDAANDNLSEGHAWLSDHAIGYWEHVELAERLKKSETMSGRTGCARTKRR